MADSGMFGAPIGIAAAEDQINQNVRSGLLAQKTLGEIAQQPAELELKRAHARLYGAQADVAEAGLRDQKMLDDLARLTAANRLAASEGRTATAEDLTAVERPQSLATPYLEMLDIAQRRGLPPRLTLELANKTSTILQHEASAFNSRAEAEVRQLNAGRARAERAAALAQAALDNPEAYPQILAQAASDGFPAARLPQTFNEATLKAIRDAGLSAKDAADLKLKQAEDKRKADAAKLNKQKADAYIGVASARTELIKERTTQLKKEGGPNADSAREARAELAKARRLQAFAKFDKLYPTAPADPKMWVDGAKYRLPNGTFIVASKQGGTVGGTPVQVPDEVRNILFKQSPGTLGGSSSDDSDLGDDELPPE